MSAFASPDGTHLTLVLLNIDGPDCQVTIDPGTGGDGGASTLHDHRGLSNLRHDRARRDPGTTVDRQHLRPARVGDRHGNLRPVTTEGPSDDLALPFHDPDLTIEARLDDLLPR